MFFSGKISNTSQQFPRQDYRRKQFETPAQEISEGPPSAVTVPWILFLLEILN